MNGSPKITLLSKCNTGLSCGRVQSPTLIEIYKRCKEISEFKPSDSYKITGQIDIGAEFYDVESSKNYSREFIDNLSLDYKSLNIVNYSIKPSSVNSPRLYNKTGLVKDMASKYGYKSGVIDEAGQSLYEKYKVMSYYRTSGQYLDNKPATKSSVCSSVSILLNEDSDKTWDRLNKTRGTIFNQNRLSASKADHHAIILKNLKDYSGKLMKMDEVESRMFNLIKNRMIRITLGPVNFDLLSIVFEIKDKTSDSIIEFELKASRSTKDGFLEYFDNERSDYNYNLNLFKLNLDNTPYAFCNKGERKVTTRAPFHYTDGSIQGWMETKKIGTPATMSKTLKRLRDIGYITYDKGNKLIVTELGEYVSKTLVDTELGTPNLTRKLEKFISNSDMDNALPLIREIHESLDKTKDLLVGTKYEKVFMTC